MCGTIVMRLILGPMCDKYGPRLTMAIVLVAGAIPTGLTGLINSATDLILIRLFIGVIGSCFVMCQYWTTTMFNREVAGTANAIVGGWGNLGGGEKGGKVCVKSRLCTVPNQFRARHLTRRLLVTSQASLSSSWAPSSSPSSKPA